jgi:vacuolar-type H+-ATPase subunit H
MTDPDTQTFRLLDPSGQEIMSGPMSLIMENIPDSNARNSALEEAVHAAQQAVEAEQRLHDARACAAQIISDTVTRLCHRLDAYLTRQEEQQRQDEEQALRQEQEEIQRTLDQLPDPDNPDDPDEPHAFDQKEREASLTGTGDDGDLTVKHEVDPERYGEVEEDAEAPVKPVLSYGRVPLSYIKKKDATGDLPEGVESRAPAPLGSNPVYDPADLGKPEDPKQVQQPISSGLW